jgi:hypothetical protein
MTQPFCSMACRALADRQEKVCQNCGVTFWKRGRMSGRMFCSPKCANEGARIAPILCAECGTSFRRGKPSNRFCSRTCSAKANARKRPGQLRNPAGYILEWNPPHPNAAKSGYVMQHRRVMAEVMGRPLTKDEVVDHINGVKDDNRPENLRVLTAPQHNSLPKPPRKPIECPHCHATLLVSGRVRRVEVLSPPRSDAATS